jgi:hypothetical protein
MRLIKSFLVTFLLLMVCGVFAFAQTARRATALNADQLDRAAQPTVQQTILRAAAAKVRASRVPVQSVELPVTVSTSTISGCYQICVGTGVNRACTAPCDIMD